MERINFYLTDLLALYDCVILPNFGGFITNYHPATVNGNNLFTPPKKNIAFNPQLKSNDGLLASTIVAIEGISYEEANKHIGTYIASIKKSLKAKGAYSIGNLGEFNFSDNILTFEPNTNINLLTSTLLLKTFHAVPLHKNNVRKNHNHKPRSTRLIIFNRVAIASMLILSIFSLLLNQDTFSGINLTSLVPSFSIGNTSSLTRSDKLWEVSSYPVKIDLESNNNKQFVLSSNTTIIDTPVKSSVVNNYHVIVGCFVIKENAEKQIANLKSKGVMARTFAYNKKMTGVLVGSFTTYKEAQKMVYNLRYGGKSHYAWVLKREMIK